MNRLKFYFVSACLIFILQPVSVLAQMDLQPYLTAVNFYKLNSGSGVLDLSLDIAINRPQNKYKLFYGINTQTLNTLIESRQANLEMVSGTDISVIKVSFDLPDMADGSKLFYQLFLYDQNNVMTYKGQVDSLTISKGVKILTDDEVYSQQNSSIINRWQDYVSYHPNEIRILLISIAIVVMVLIIVYVIYRRKKQNLS